MAKKKQLSPKYQVWIDARKRHNLSHAHIQMARELGMNPIRSLGNWIIIDRSLGKLRCRYSLKTYILRAMARKDQKSFDPSNRW